MLLGTAVTVTVAQKIVHVLQSRKQLFQKGKRRW